MEKLNQHNEQIQVFKPSRTQQFMLFLVTLPIAIFMIIVLVIFPVNYVITVGILAFAFILYGLFLLMMYLAGTQSITFYEDGIEHRYGNRILWARWDELSHFEWRDIGDASIGGIVTSVPMQQYHNGSQIEQAVQRTSDVTFMEVTIIVPLPTKSDGLFKPREIDTVKVQETDFGKLLYDYAPQLFAQEE